MSYLHMQKRRTRKKERMVFVMGGQCIQCKYNKCIEALEFHHIDPSTKSFSFNKAKSYSWEQISSELKKCVIVCANCHREIHQGFYSTKTFSSSFDESRDEQWTSFTTSKPSLCISCGKEIDRKAKRCKSCSYVYVRKTIRPGKCELMEAIRNNSFLKVGELYGVSDNAVKKWCRTYNLPATRAAIKRLSDAEWDSLRTTI